MKSKQLSQKDIYKFDQYYVWREERQHNFGVCTACQALYTYYMGCLYLVQTYESIMKSILKSIKQWFREHYSPASNYASHFLFKTQLNPVLDHNYAAASLRSSYSWPHPFISLFLVNRVRTFREFSKNNNFSLYMTVHKIRTFQIIGYYCTGPELTFRIHLHAVVSQCDSTCTLMFFAYCYRWSIHVHVRHAHTIDMYLYRLMMNYNSRRNYYIFAQERSFGGLNLTRNNKLKANGLACTMYMY